MVVYLQNPESTATYAPVVSFTSILTFRSTCWNETSPKSNRINLVSSNPKTKCDVKFSYM